MTGQEWPRPGIGVLQAILALFFISHALGGCWPSPLPEACGPRKDGQLRGVVTGSTLSSTISFFGIRSLAEPGSTRRSFRLFALVLKVMPVTFSPSRWNVKDT